MSSLPPPAPSDTSPSPQPAAPRRSWRRFIPHAILAALVLFAVAWSSVAAAFVPLPDGPNDFNSPGFVVRHVWVKFGMLATTPLRPHESEAQKDAKVQRFFELNAQIAQQERIAGDPTSDPQAAAAARASGDALRAERSRIENNVELILEGRLTRVIKEAGLTRHFGGDIVWPPVNIEFQDPPSVLVKSPRTEIKKQSETLLQGDLPIERVQSIEANAERDGKTSALVVEIGGIAMYPAIIPPDADYRFVVEDIAHEWTHLYLFFAPLGRHYFSGGNLTTLNETLADMVGRELGDMLYAEYPPQQQPDAAATAQPAAPAPAIDFTAEVRDLRRQVEALLKDGKPDDAEHLMEQKREYLAANGYYIRRLNQAYFAFHGSYADTAGSIDPIGPKLEQLRKQSASLQAFVDRAREFTSEGDLDRALATR